MHFYVTLTTNCNMQCRYCYGKCVDDIGYPFPFDMDEFLPSSITYDVADLAKFMAKDPEPVLIFYGGEPTLALPDMRCIMDTIPAKAYIIQTNGLLLDKLEPEYINRFHTILVSIDGDEYLTDHYRGTGTYRRVIDNLKHLRRNGFRGELIARMTITPETNIYHAVNWLLFNAEFPFKSVHWQLDAQFWQSDYERERVQRWLEHYNRDIQRLIENWITHMEKTGKVLRMYPFIGVILSLLTNTATKLRCGAGWTEFNIQTDGKITPCPVMAGIKAFYLGNIWETVPESLANTVFVTEPCTRCSISQICGGRCLYTNTTKFWGDEGFRLVCRTVENLISSLRAIQPRISRLISSGQLATADFVYSKYNSCEVIP